MQQNARFTDFIMSKLSRENHQGFLSLTTTTQIRVEHSIKILEKIEAPDNWTKSAIKLSMKIQLYSIL